MINRRSFIKGAMVVAAIGSGGWILWDNLQARLAVSSAPLKPILIYVLQRGGMDGLAAVCPYTDPNIKNLRPHLVMNTAPYSEAKEDCNIDLDGVYGLHPSLRPLYPLFAAKQLAIVHGTGLTIRERSHFEAQDFIESGVPGDKSVRSGWLNRLAGSMPAAMDTLQAVSLTQNLPRILSGPFPCVAMSGLDEFRIRSNAAMVQSIETIKKSYLDQQGSLGKMAQDTFATSDALGKLKAGNGPIAYPKTAFGNAFRQMAVLIKAEMGLKIGFLESGGWDTHTQEGTVNGAFSRPAKEFAQSVAAFWEDIGDLKERVVVVASSEFGRTVAENGSQGTDHGRGSCMFVLGNKVNGGKVYGSVPILEQANLEDKRDLPVTTDYRTVLATVLRRHMAIRDLAKIFPDWKGKELDIWQA